MASGSEPADFRNETTPSGFDPYHKWLGIPPNEQPPNHYRLLAIGLFETDLDVIEAAAVARSTYVRQCATGPHANASQQVLNELSAAQICLLNPEQKAAYDAQLKTGLAATSKESASKRAGQSTETVSTGQKAPDAKLQQLTQKLDKQKQQIESMLEKCEFATAIGALEKMAAVKNSKASQYVKWAQQQLPKAKRGTTEMRESTGAIYRTAADLVGRYDYEEAAEILQQIPRKYRNPQVGELLQKCLDLQEEIAAIQEDIDRAESLNKYEDLQPTVERLLEIKPGDRRAKKLLKELKTYGKGGGMRLGDRGDERFDAAGNTSNPLKAAMFVGIPLVLFGIVGWATVSYLRSSDKTITIEIDDPSAKVTIDGKEIEITGVGDRVKLKTGTHELVVERDDAVVETRQFEVVQGKNPVLQISLNDDLPGVTGDRGTEVAGTSTSPANGIDKPGVLAKEFTWNQGEPPVLLTRGNDGFAYLSGVGGALMGGGRQMQVSINNEGDWLLSGGKNRGIQSGGAHSMPWFASAKRTPTFKTWNRGQPDFKQLIHQRDGFCALSLVGGVFRGGGEQVRLRVGEDGYWRLNARSKSPKTRARVTVIEMKQPGSFQGIVREHVWKTGQKRVRLIHSEDGFAMLTGIGGAFAGGAEMISVSRNDEDGYWYLNGRSKQRSVVAWACSIQLTDPATK